MHRAPTPTPDDEQPPEEHPVPRVPSPEEDLPVPDHNPSSMTTDLSGEDIR